MSAHAILSHLTHAAESLQAAHELAIAGGAVVPATIMQRASVFVGSSIAAVIEPLDLAGVLQPPVKVPRPRGVGGVL